jgi:hypothetical protein
MQCTQFPRHADKYNTTNTDYETRLQCEHLHTTNRFEHCSVNTI